MARRKNAKVVNKGKSNPKMNYSKQREPSTSSQKSDSTRNESESSKDSTDSTGDGKDDRNVIIPSKSNDFEWYNSDPYLIESAARVPFSEAFGDILNPTPGPGSISVVNTSTNLESTIAIKHLRDSAVPGIMVMRTLPSFGYNSKITDPLNLAATALYAHVRYNNNGRKNYDPSDLMMYCLTFSELYGYVLWLEKLYGLCYMYSSRNKYIGKELIRACGASESLISNLANFRYWINTFINRISSYAVPDSISLFKRRAFMYSSIYTESETGNLKDQLYSFKPAGFFKFCLDTDGAGMLDILKVPDYPLTLDQIVQIGNSLFENIEQDEDFGLMSGDILKAFGSNILGAPELPEAYYVIPVYDHEVLTQFKNATICGWVEDNLDYWFWRPKMYTSTPGIGGFAGPAKLGQVKQNSRGVLYHAYFTPSYGTYTREGIFAALVNTASPVLSTDVPSPETSDVVELTRMKTTIKNTLDAAWIGDEHIDDLTYSHELVALSCGSDIAVSISLYVNDWRHNMNELDSQISRYKYSTMVLLDVDDPDATESGLEATELVELAYLKSFKYAPMFMLFGCLAGTSDEFNFISFASDLQNYAVVSKDQLDKIHSAALLSLMHVPGVAQVVSQPATK